MSDGDQPASSLGQQRAELFAGMLVLRIMASPDLQKTAETEVNKEKIGDKLKSSGATTWQLDLGSLAVV